jgi:predicted phosphohydrolase
MIDRVRLVAVADTHLYHDELSVPDGDVFIHAGDLCRRGDLFELERAAHFIRCLPHRHKIVIAGNHDWAFVDSPERARELLGADVVYLQDSETTLDGVRFWGSPWQPEFCDWAFNLPRGAALAEKWALIPAGLDVLVTHGPPAGIGDRSSTGGRQGCADLLARVREVRPRLHLFGHIHEDGGVWQIGETTFANVTTWECERAPTVIDLDSVEIRVDAPPAKS